MGVWGRPVLVQACVNGGRRRAEHPAVPLSPDEIARDASRAVAAGAAALHVHPRAADRSETLDPAICDAVVAAVRGACPGIPIGLTTAIWIEPDAGRRLELVTSWAVPPDFVSHQPVRSRRSRVVRSPAIATDRHRGWRVDGRRRADARRPRDR
jgi:uncharacterized protein (DUF849 family)